MFGKTLLAFLTLTAILIAPGCSVRRFAVNRIGDALAAGGSTFEKDDDPELIGDAMPFGLKLIESLLEESPQHRGLLLAACRGFALYAYAYVQQEADRITVEDLERGNLLRLRSRRLYLRARGHGLRALELSHPGVPARMEKDPKSAVTAVRKKDVPLLYWNAAALGLAISASRNDAELLSRIPEVEALLDRALELDESWLKGSLHEFYIVFAAARPGSAALDLTRMKRHYDRALALSGGKRASLHTAWAEGISVRTQNRAEFRAMIEKALAVDADAEEESRLANLVAQRRARWLLGRIDELFLEEEPKPATNQEERKQ